MANFFIKPKDKPTGGAGASLKHSSEKEIIPVKSDFETVFKPFVLRKGAELAPRNRFLYPEKLGSNRIENGVIILEDGEHPNKTTTSMEIDFASLSNRGMFASSSVSFLIITQSDCNRFSLHLQ
jgi:chromatin assembly factor 1 subunit A